LKECDHGDSEEAIGVSHVEELAVLGLGKDSEINGCDVLVASIDYGRTILHEFEGCESLEILFTELVADLLFGPFALLLDM